MRGPAPPASCLLKRPPLRSFGALLVWSSNAVHMHWSVEFFAQMRTEEGHVTSVFLLCCVSCVVTEGIFLWAVLRPVPTKDGKKVHDHPPREENPETWHVRLLCLVGTQGHLLMFITSACGTKLTTFPWPACPPPRPKRSVFRAPWTQHCRSFNLQTRLDWPLEVIYTATCLLLRSENPSDGRKMAIP